MTGLRSYHAGLAAEDSVVRHYLASGMSVLARRWKGRAGEIDLVLRAGEGLVFVEVKQSRSHQRAALHLGPSQMGRLGRAATEFLGTMPLGQNTDCRFDLALVDGTGRVEIIENIFLA